MVRDDDAGARRNLLTLRQSTDYRAAFDEAEPLVSIVIPTYNNWPQLRERSLPSVLAQSYQNWECIIVGDCAPEETREVIDSFDDDRISVYEPSLQRAIPGQRQGSVDDQRHTAVERRGRLSRGKWIAAHADDDALRPDTIDVLLQHAKDHQAEVAYGSINQMHPDGTVTRLGTFPPQIRTMGMQGSLLHAGLRFLPLLPSDWVFEIPNDMSLMERMLRIGVRFSMVEQTTVDYYPSTLWGSAERLLWEQDG